MLVDCGEEPTIPDAKFTVAANIYSECCNEYVHHWEGGTFDNYDEAYEFWDKWDPPKEEVDEVMRQRREEGDYSHHELEIGVWSENPNESAFLAFMNETLDYEHERN